MFPFSWYLSRKIYLLQIWQILCGLYKDALRKTVAMNSKIFQQLNSPENYKNLTELFFEKDKNFKQTKAMKRTQKINGESELKNGYPKGGNGKTEFEWVSYFCSVWCFKDCSYQSLERFLFPWLMWSFLVVEWGMAVVSVLNFLFLLTPLETQAGRVIFTHTGHHNLYLTTKANISSNAKTLKAFLLNSK